MIKVMPWDEREFRFDLPNALFPNLVERARGAPARLTARVQHQAPAVLTTRLDGHWSIQETIGHLAELEVIHVERTEELLRGADRLTPVDLSEIDAGVLRYNEMSIEESLTIFRNRRESTVRLLDGTRAEDLSRTALHELLGVGLRMIDHVWFMVEHDDHHLAGITELLRALQD